MLCIFEKLPAGNIPVPNAALQVEWLYMSYHKSNHAEFVRSGNKLNTEYFQGIHDVKISDGPIQQKRESDSTIHQKQDARWIGKAVPWQNESLYP